jgi:hypothetical protein
LESSQYSPLTMLTPRLEQDMSNMAKLITIEILHEPDPEFIMHLHFVPDFALKLAKHRRMRQ